MYVVLDLHTPLLGQPAITKLELEATLDSTDIQTLKEMYPSLCGGLGRLQQPYTIKGHEGATGFQSTAKFPGHGHSTWEIHYSPSRKRQAIETCSQRRMNGCGDMLSKTLLTI